jgi:hypothetical protein
MAAQLAASQEGLSSVLSIFPCCKTEVMLIYIRNTVGCIYLFLGDFPFHIYVKQILLSSMKSFTRFFAK